MRAPKRPGRAAGAALLAAGLALGAVELALRGSRGAPPPGPSALRDIYGPAFAPAPDGRSYASTGKLPSPAAFAARKAAGLRRIFLVGESAAAEFAAHNPVPLPEMLARLYPDSRFELIPCGVPGFDSLRAALVVEEILRYQPDLVIVMSGNNEHHPHAPPRWVLRLDEAFSGSWCYRLLKEALAPGASESPTHERRLRRYARNLARMARLCRARGVPVAFCTLPANALDYPPHGDSAGRFSDPDFARASIAFDRGDYLRAASALESYDARRPQDPLALYLLGRSELRLGRPDAARKHLLSALELDSRPGTRSPPSRAELVRSLARESGALTVDLARGFEERSAHGLVGAQFMVNHVHWRRRYNPFAASLIAKAVEKSGLWPENLAPPAARRRAWLDLSAAVLDAETSSEDASWHQGLCRVRDMEAGRLEETAVWLFESVAGRDPAGLRRLLRFEALRGLLQAEGCHFPEQTDDWLRARWPRVLLHAGEGHRRRGELRTALGFLERAESLGENSAPLYRALLFCAQSLGMRERALAAYLRYSELPGLAGEAKSYASALGFRPPADATSTAP